MVANGAMQTSFVDERLGALTCAVRRAPGRQRDDAPVLFGLHGRGSSPEKRFRSALAFGGHFTHVLPRATIPFEDGFAWYLKGPNLEAHVRAARQALFEMVEAARVRFPHAPFAVWGFSQGGRMAMELQVRAKDAFRCAVSLAGKLHEATAANEAIMRQARGRRFLLVHGTEDTLAPLSLSSEAKAALDAVGAKVDLCELPIGHEIEALSKAAVRGYLSQHATR